MRRIILSILITLCGIITSQAETIQMIGHDEYGYNLPKYISSAPKASGRIKLRLKALADDKNFPISSLEQGSVFSKIFDEMLIKNSIQFSIIYRPETYQKAVRDFERNESGDVNAHFGVYYKDAPYSKNQYIYPAFFTNDVHIITSLHNKLELAAKNDLKKYKGVHVQTDKISDFVAKDFASFNIKEVESFSKAFELLLTGEIDYIAASYYLSLIELYKTGIRDYVAYSQEPVWKIPMFIRVHPQLMKSPKIKELENILKSDEYKKQRDELLTELVEIYQENTRGIVPPKYVKETPDNTAESEPLKIKDNF